LFQLFSTKSPIEEEKMAKVKTDENETKSPSREAEPLPTIDQKTAQIIWLTIVSTLSASLVISVIVLGISVFTQAGGTSSDLVLTVITTIAGFLIGLLAPSPVAKG
jgi:uncharacterized membrane protein YqaE (UPF0057 family)